MTEVSPAYARQLAASLINAFKEEAGKASEVKLLHYTQKQVAEGADLSYTSSDNRVLLKQAISSNLLAPTMYLIEAIANDEMYLSIDDKLEIFEEALDLPMPFSKEEARGIRDLISDGWKKVRADAVAAEAAERDARPGGQPPPRNRM